MPLELSEQQQQSLDAAGETQLRVTDPWTRVTYMLVPEVEYADLQELLGDDRRQRGIQAVGRRNAMGRLTEEP